MRSHIYKGRGSKCVYFACSNFDKFAHLINLNVEHLFQSNDTIEGNRARFFPHFIRFVLTQFYSKNRQYFIRICNTYRTHTHTSNLSVCLNWSAHSRVHVCIYVNVYVVYVFFIAHCIYFYYIRILYTGTQNWYITQSVMYQCYSVPCVQYMNIEAYWSHNTGDSQEHHRCTIHIDTIVSNYSWWGRRVEVKEKKGSRRMQHYMYLYKCDETIMVVLLLYCCAPAIATAEEDCNDVMQYK